MLKDDFGETMHTTYGVRSLTLVKGDKTDTLYRVQTPSFLRVEIEKAVSCLFFFCKISRKRKNSVKISLNIT